MMYDRDIREPLFEFLEEYYGKVRIIEEKRMGRSRADVVMVLADAVCGLEIKSDADTYARLSRQVQDYDQYCDFNFIVAGTRHAHHVAEHVPDWWGILTVELEEGRPDFYFLRQPQANPKVDWKKKMSLLWRPELVHIQELNQMPRYREKSKQFVIDRILLKVPREKLYRQISQELFERDYTKITEEIRAYKKERKATRS
ncbi:MAG: sce7726 family protein [Lachnospiraceae bacterium]|nr:sce7726 family protein [Lachnospiraceae bacterium]